jgi:hypothetical protein
MPSLNRFSSYCCRLEAGRALQHAPDPAAVLAARTFPRTDVTRLAEGVRFAARGRRPVGGRGPPARPLTVYSRMTDSNALPAVSVAGGPLVS